MPTQRKYIYYWNDDNNTVYVYGLTQIAKRGSQEYHNLLSEGRVEHGQWLIRPESRHVDLSKEILEMNVPPTIFEMNVAPIIAKLNEVITVMKNFYIQVNLGNIYGTINQVAQQINFLEYEQNGYPMMMKLLANVNSRLTITNQGIKL